jgi:hypothetical protein
MQHKVALEFVWRRYIFRKHNMNEVIGLSILENLFLPSRKVSTGAADKRVLVACKQCINIDKVG